MIDRCSVLSDKCLNGFSVLRGAIPCIAFCRNWGKRRMPSMHSLFDPWCPLTAAECAGAGLELTCPQNLDCLGGLNRTGHWNKPFFAASLNNRARSTNYMFETIFDPTLKSLVVSFKFYVQGLSAVSGIQVGFLVKLKTSSKQQTISQHLLTTDHGNVGWYNLFDKPITAWSQTYLSIKLTGARCSKDDYHMFSRLTSMLQKVDHI